MLPRLDSLLATTLLLAIWPLAGCADKATYSPGTERKFREPRKHEAVASDPDAGALLVTDIGPLEGGGFRWTGANPEVKLELPETRGLQLHARFWLAEATLKKTGPIEIAYVVNGNELFRTKYSTPGEQNFDRPVDASALKVGSNTLRMAIDKTAAQEDGTRMGVALVELGFTN